jgi:hypothetical protein
MHISSDGHPVFADIFILNLVIFQSCFSALSPIHNECASDMLVGYDIILNYGDSDLTVTAR